MKTNKVLVLVAVIAILTGGAFAGLRYLEGRVIAASEKFVADHDSVKVGSMTFSLPSRIFILKDAEYTMDKDIGGPVTQKIEYAEMVLPWSLILSPDQKEGTVTVSFVEYKNLVVSGEMGTTSIGRHVLTNATLDMGHAYRYAAGERLELAELYESITFDKAVLEDVKSLVPGEAEVRVSSIELNAMKGLKIESVHVYGLEFAVANYAYEMKPLLSIDISLFDKLEIPANALRMLCEMDAEDFDSPAVVQTLFQNMLGGQAPLFSTISLQRVKVSEEVLPATIESVAVDWSSVKPMKYSSSIAGLSIPATYLEKDFGLSLPLLKSLEINTKVSVAGNADGTMEEQNSYFIKDLLNIEARTVVSLEEGTLMMPTTIWDASNIASARLKSFEVTLEDKGIIPYAVWNYEGPKATGEKTVQLVKSMNSADKEAATRMRESLSSFIEKSGKLTVSFVPEQPVPMMAIMQVIMDPASFLTFSAVPGGGDLKASLELLRDAKTPE